MTIGWKLNSFYLELDLPFYQKEKRGQERNNPISVTLTLIRETGSRPRVGNISFFAKASPSIAFGSL